MKVSSLFVISVTSNLQYTVIWQDTFNLNIKVKGAMYACNQCDYKDIKQQECLLSLYHKSLYG